jgi:acetyltransferase EpsM
MNIYGAGEHAAVIIGSMIIQGIRPGLIYDDNSTVHEVFGYSVSKEIQDNREPWILAIGDNRDRKKIAESIDLPFDNFKATNAWIGANTYIGKGVVLLPGSVVQVKCTLGNHVIINSGAVIEHDCELADYVHIASNATVSSKVKIGEGALIGAGAVIIPDIKIGAWATVGAGAVVVRDVQDGDVVKGNPAQ